MYNVFQSNPGYRKNIQRLLNNDQVRGQAWSLRTLAEAAYITPDDDRLKSHFARVLQSNLDWYNATYTNNVAANVFGVIDTKGAVIYNSKRGIAQWQDDFFTSAVGHAAELGFDDARTLLGWKAKAPVLRMTDPAMCWIDASLYSMNIRDSETSPMYTTMAEVVAGSQSDGFRALACGSAEMASFLGLKVGEMTGYSSSVTGYPSNMQPALAYAVDARLPNAAAGWTRYGPQRQAELRQQPAVRDRAALSSLRRAGSTGSTSSTSSTSSTKPQPPYGAWGFFLFPYSALASAPAASGPAAADGRGGAAPITLPKAPGAIRIAVRYTSTSSAVVNTGASSQ